MQLDQLFHNQIDVMVMICKYLTIWDIHALECTNKSISKSLKSERNWIMKHHKFIQPHNVGPTECDTLALLHFCGDFKQRDAIGYYIEGRFHRNENDLPAVVAVNGDQYWVRRGDLHRDGDLPAVILANGELQWWRNGKLHRDGDFPAKIYADGELEWYKNGKRHRDGDLPARITFNNIQFWYKHGKEHRDNNQPSCVSPDGYKHWCVEGRLIKIEC
jgi:hypothetical protein